MLEDKRPGFIGVASEADLVLSCSSSQLASKESAMRIVAVTAGNQTFVYAMMEWFRELRLHFGVASVAKHRLRHRKERALHFGMMSRVAVDAANIVLQVL